MAQQLAEHRDLDVKALSEQQHVSKSLSSFGITHTHTHTLYSILALQ